MVPESFLFQLVLFLAAQFAAWGNMLTGRFPLGFVQFALTFGLADALLLMRFVARDADDAFASWLVVFQVLCVATAVDFTLRRLLRRAAPFRQRQRTLFEEALDAFMAGRDDAALSGFRRAFRRDPWDAESACMVAGILGSRDLWLRARVWYSRARARARQPMLRDEIDEEVRCLKVRKTEQATRRKAARTPRPAGQPRQAGKRRTAAG